MPSSGDHGVASLGSIMQCIEIDTKKGALNGTEASIESSTIYSYRPMSKLEHIGDLAVAPELS